MDVIQPFLIQGMVLKGSRVPQLAEWHCHGYNCVDSWCISSWFFFSSFHCKHVDVERVKDVICVP